MISYYEKAEKQMDILVIHTGGTISCKSENGVLVPHNDITPILTKLSKEIKGVRFRHRHLCSVLSETLDGRVLSKIINCVKRAADSKKYGGIIVTHGSDTAIYTAAALSYVLGVSSIPCVTVCADLPLTDPLSSGHANLRAAISVIADGNARGSFAVYPTTSRSVAVHRGSRLMQQLPYETAFSSSAGAFYGIVENEKLIKNNDYAEKPDDFRLRPHKLSALCPVAFVTVYPGMTYPALGKRTKAVILCPYHSGTLNTDSRETKRFAELCKKRNITVYVSGTGANADYETMESYPKLGFLRLPPLTSPNAMLIKLWLLFSQKDLDAEKHVALPLGGDM